MNDPLTHPARERWLAPETGWLARIQRHMQQCHAHPARTVVLVPYAQLMPVVARLWAQAYPDGFAPRIETTQNWSRSLGSLRPAATDIAQELAMDVLTARALLEGAGLGAQGDALAPSLVAAAQQLVPLVAALEPGQRQAWAAQARVLVLTGMEAPALLFEAAVARIAVEWAALSAYASDVLLEPRISQELDALVVLQGFQPDPLMLALAAKLGVKALALSLDEPGDEALRASISGRFQFHCARDAEDEAQRAAACVLRHVNAGRAPVALVATDRSLTRRVRAMLAASGLRLRDETGWKLSTSRAAAQVMGALRACVWNAASDAVLDWLKNAPGFEPAAVLALEKELRRQQVRDWRACDVLASLQVGDLGELLASVNAQRDTLQRPRPLVSWLNALRELLQGCGQWNALRDDVAGEGVLKALHLMDEASSERLQALGQAMGAQRRLDLSEFTSWVNQVLEGASFTPAYPLDEQVVILPLRQLLARPFAAVVLPGCDEVRLSPSPEPPGDWTPAQREGLGLESRATLEAATRAAWRHALQTPSGDVLWRQSDEAGETLLPSSLVQALQLTGVAEAGSDPRLIRPVALQPGLPPLPRGDELPVPRLSASAYDDLRHCPYRFFALRQLGLKEEDELEGELDKRDFGLWLHEVLKRFHEALQALPQDALAARRQMIDVAAGQVTASMRLEEGEFLPFAAAWPQVREGYLQWLTQHEAGGARFAQAEIWREQSLGELTLVGKIDRIDRLPDGTTLVMDYKTEAQGKTRERIKLPLEDTQLAFYAALLPDDQLRAAYVNVGEKDGTKPFEQAEVVHVRDALIEGILHDLGQVAQGVVLPALGEGVACDFCAARGLCRKDFWELA